MVEIVAIIALLEAWDALSFEPRTLIGYWFGHYGPDRPPVALRLIQAQIKLGQYPRIYHIWVWPRIISELCTIKYIQ